MVFLESDTDVVSAVFLLVFEFALLVFMAIAASMLTARFFKIGNMEIVSALAVIMVLCLILKVPFNWLILGFLSAIRLFDVVLFLLFGYHLARLFGTKRTEATFLEIRQENSSTFAYYSIQGEEFSSAFPVERFLRKFYDSSKERYVLLNARTKLVYDIFDVIACVMGLLFTVLFLVSTAFAGGLFSLFM